MDSNGIIKRAKTRRIMRAHKYKERIYRAASVMPKIVILVIKFEKKNENQID